jgi:hypothetical protein
VTRDRIIIAREWAQYRGGLTAYRHDSTYAHWSVEQVRVAVAGQGAEDSGAVVFAA